MHRALQVGMCRVCAELHGADGHEDRSQAHVEQTRRGRKGVEELQGRRTSSVGGLGGQRGISRVKTALALCLRDPARASAI